MRPTFAAGLLGTLLLIPSVSVLRAAEPDCSFEPQFERLTAAQNESASDYFAAIRAELQIRKEILRNIIHCAVADIRALHTSIKNISPQNEEAEQLRTRFLQRLDDAIRYHESQLGKISDLGIRGSQNLARELKEWRASQFAPLADGAVNLALWLKNQELIRAAENRFGQIEKTIRTLKLIENEGLKPIFEEASQALHNTLALNGSTKEALSDNDPSNALTLIKSSLEALSRTYALFFKLSEAAGKIIPHGE